MGRRGGEGEGSGKEGRGRGGRWGRRGGEVGGEWEGGEGGGEGEEEGREARWREEEEGEYEGGGLLTRVIISNHNQSYSFHNWGHGRVSILPRQLPSRAARSSDRSPGPWPTVLLSHKHTSA